MTQKEKTIENRIKAWLESNGYWHMKVHGSMYQKSGVPDIITCMNGRFVGIEVKRPGGQVSALQEFHIEAIRKSGGVAFVAYSFDDAIEQLRQFDVI